MKKRFRIVSIALVLLLGLNLISTPFAEKSATFSAAETSSTVSGSEVFPPVSNEQALSDSAGSFDSAPTSSESLTGESDAHESGSAEAAAEPTPTVTPIPTNAAIPTDAPTSTATPTDTPTSTEAPTPTVTPTDTPTDMPISTEMPTDTPIPTEIPTDTPIPTETPTQTDIPQETTLPTAVPESGDEQEDQPNPSINPETTVVPEETLQPEEIEETPDDEHEVIIRKAYPSEWHGKIPEDGVGMPIPILYQGDYKQPLCIVDGKVRTVASSGCGATSVSMIIAYLTGNTEQTPYSLFLDAIRIRGYSGTGLDHGTLSMLADEYGVHSNWIPNDADGIISALKDGKPIVAHMGPGIFTDGGHYIVLRGLTDDGFIVVNDPASRYRTGRAYPVDLFLAQARRDHAFMVCWVDDMPGLGNDEPEAEIVDPVANAIPVLCVEGFDTALVEYVSTDEILNAEKQTEVCNDPAEEQTKVGNYEKQTLVGNAASLLLQSAQTVEQEALALADLTEEVKPMRVEYAAENTAEEEAVNQTLKTSPIFRSAAPKTVGVPSMLRSAAPKAVEMPETRVSPMEVEYVYAEEPMRIGNLYAAPKIGVKEQTETATERSVEDAMENPISAGTQPLVRKLKSVSVNVSATALPSDGNAAQNADTEQIELIPMEIEYFDPTETEKTEESTEVEPHEENLEETLKSAQAEESAEAFSEQETQEAGEDSAAEEPDASARGENCEPEREEMLWRTSAQAEESTEAFSEQEAQEAGEDSAAEEPDASAREENCEPENGEILWLTKDVLEPVPKGTRKVITRTKRLYLRGKPDQKTGDILGMIVQIWSELELIDTVRNEETGEDWYLVSANGTTGYICGRYARIADTE